VNELLEEVELRSSRDLEQMKEKVRDQSRLRREGWIHGRLRRDAKENAHVEDDVLPKSHLHLPTLHHQQRSDLTFRRRRRRFLGEDSGLAVLLLDRGFLCRRGGTRFGVGSERDVLLGGRGGSGTVDIHAVVVLVFDFRDGEEVGELSGKLKEVELVGRDLREKKRREGNERGVRSRFGTGQNARE